jgi:hypothetical protein
MPPDFTPRFDIGKGPIHLTARPDSGGTPRRRLDIGDGRGRRIESLFQRARVRRGPGALCRKVHPDPRSSERTPSRQRATRQLCANTQPHPAQHFSNFYLLIIITPNAIDLLKTYRSVPKLVPDSGVYVRTLCGRLTRWPVMTKFEDLPTNTRALILAKLASELQWKKSPSIYHLAKQRQTDLMGVWRGICRKANQPICTIPVESMYPPQRPRG